MNGVINYPTIPTEIVVHLGAPDEAAENLSLPFVDYIKNVASNEIYPTWPDSAIEANILAQISFALNRIYNEWYPSKGYTFDITSLPAYDQSFVKNRQVFDTISKKVDQIFNNYVYRTGQIQPLNAVYCDGKVTTCNGLSQWGSVSLARQNKTPLEILKYYYGNDVNIKEDAPIGEVFGAYPGYPIELGNAGDKVRIIQRELNRISNNYPAIPKIPRVNGVFGVYTQNSVKKFQEIFNLNPTGIVDYSTWYKIKYIYNAVKRVNDIYSEGIGEEEAIYDYGNELKYSDVGLGVRVLHYVLLTIAYFDPDLPSLRLNSVFNDNTKAMVINFQKKYGLPATGVVDADTWNELVTVYRDTIHNIPEEYAQYGDEFFQGRLLALGMSGDDVRIIQKFLLKICQQTGNIPGVRVSGIFDDLMEKSVMKIQSIFNQDTTGVIDPVTWYNIVEYSKQKE
ncbi:MAG: peptidoglycan-binding protein [Bacilli bacterium]|nr:peptidoglycan-binding protein [bacterium]MDD6941175.1 peptidoglycan-binding protein [bacterium]MDY2697196.1 peptidoglycan-binding protein [Bacilli bacterium]MDY5992926.1 peptidoglycan-binding protein [Bacilli bacterium]MEE0014670.1 peptidoglycan-binding protein [Bacilli bacterium]